MNEVEFRRMLERYPVVRKKTYARVEWNALHAKDAEQSTNTSLVHDDTQLRLINAADSLHDAVGTFLDAHFPAKDVSAIQRAFSEAQHEFIASLSLDDINDICAQFVASAATVE